MSLKPSDLHVILVTSNPKMFKIRPKLFNEAVQRFMNSGVKLILVEATFGERSSEVAQVVSDNVTYVPVRCDDEIWLKESLIRKGCQYLPPDWKYMLAADADIEFTHDDWPLRVLNGLQHYSVLQPFSHAIDMGPHKEILETHKSFGYCYNNGHKLNIPHNTIYGPFFHPGYGFAWRRAALEGVGGYMDFAICGAGDHHMACAFIGEAKQSMPGQLHQSYYDKVYAWEQRALKAIDKNIGHIQGTLLHHFHGAKKDRGYQSRWQILQNNKYDPHTDIEYDMNGIIKLTGNKPKLRDDLRDYFSKRNEDTLVA